MKPCTVYECDEPARGRGMCKRHWARWRRTGDPGGRAAHPPTCTYGTCDRPYRSRGLCHMHLERWRRTGDPSGQAPVPVPEDNVVCCDCGGVTVCPGFARCLSCFGRWKDKVHGPRRGTSRPNPAGAPDRVAVKTVRVVRTADGAKR